MTKLGGSYEINFAKRFNASRSETDKKCEEVVNNQVEMLDEFTTQVAGISDIAALKN